MHLPPLDVAVYPVITMSRGRHGGRSSRASSAVSLSSSASSVSSKSGAVTPDISNIQKGIQAAFRSSKVTVQQAGRLKARLHRVYLVKLVDGDALVLKCPPTSSTRMLRHEKYGLETERITLETLHEYTQLPVPHLLSHDSQGATGRTARAALGHPFLLTSYVPGRPLSDLASYLSAEERNVVDRTLGSCVRNLTALSATQFGMTHRVFAKRGSSSWREAFLALLESALRDAEDMLVNVPYDLVRYYVARHSQSLDEVTEPRLVALHVCDPQNVLVDEHTKRVTGLVGFSNVIYGDVLMSGGIADGSDAFFEGYGQRPAQTAGPQARQLMYAIYRATVQIVAHHFRPHLGVDEDQARRSLNMALNGLAAM
ncbi:hypothetical protein K504DRAFT_393991 [Pleomassaria siparia CBS 279.74]|uniref:Aminoglycoside phosphotransferase domain-containing protein n=1 Tax=Pleomassaria siparia CBS 279.74 TaxID=1314801 RepID=A0A6G1JPY8_9PLEO|nr:hypothetical protein K504DRAFT_393991 [Pleomassaria siparia CBS 279.74]